MTDPIITDLRRELEKARQALIAAQSHLAAHAEANAALHCATTVMYSPLHARVTAAILGAEHALDRTEQALVIEAREPQLAAILLDLDRCQHGRHEGETCGDCGGPSAGNPHMRTGTVVGYQVHGRQIVMPDRERKHDPAAWRGASAVEPK